VVHGVFPLSLYIESTDSLVSKAWHLKILQLVMCTAMHSTIVNMWEVTRITMIHVPTCISYAGWTVHIGETIRRADTLHEANPRLHHSPPLDHQTTQQPGQRLLSPPMEGLYLRARLVSDAVLPREGIQY